ncbi:hypothetical protein Tco_1148563 [Tanacetum coccineum]
MRGVASPCGVKGQSPLLGSAGKGRGGSAPREVVYVLTTPMPELLEDDTVEAIRRRAKWDNDDYICRGNILNGMSDPLFDSYQNMESAKEL